MLYMQFKMKIRFIKWFQCTILDAFYMCSWNTKVKDIEFSRHKIELPWNWCSNYMGCDEYCRLILSFLCSLTPAIDIENQIRLKPFWPEFHFELQPIIHVIIFYSVRPALHGCVNISIIIIIVTVTVILYTLYTVYTQQRQEHFMMAFTTEKNWNKKKI